MNKFLKKPLLDHHRTHWQSYREFFSVAILRYFVVWFSVVPLALHVFQSVPAQVVVGDWSLDIRPSLPFSWTALWIASLAYTAALAMFTWRCPQFVRKYPTYKHYQEVGHSPRWLVWLAAEVLEAGGPPWEKLFDRLKAKNYLDVVECTHEIITEPLVQEKGTVLRFMHDGACYEFLMPRPCPGATAVAEREIFWEIFGAHSGGQRFWRGAIIVLLMFALLLFMLVLAQHIWAALPSAFGNVLELLFGGWGWLVSRVS